MRLIGFVALVWLLIGVLAAWQRGYLTDVNPDCGAAATIALNVLAGPLNYVAADPQVGECKLPDLPKPTGA